MKMRCGYENEEGVESAVEGSGKIIARAPHLVHIELPYRRRANAEMTERSSAASSTRLLTLPDMAYVCTHRYIRHSLFFMTYVLSNRIF
jgi:hypothetical protein